MSKVIKIKKGKDIQVAPGGGHIVHIPMPANTNEQTMIARYFEEVK